MNNTQINLSLIFSASLVASSPGATLLVDGVVNNHSSTATYDTITINNGGTLNLTGGGVTVPVQSPSNNVEKIYINNGSTLDISGGVHTFNERIATYGSGPSTIRITGSQATINAHQQSFFNATLEFVFDAAGVSTFDSDSRLGFGGSDLVVDASAYSGPTATFVLVDVDWLSASSGFGGSINITPPAGYTADYDQSQFTTGEGQITLTLTAVPEPSSTLLVGLAGLALILRRRR